MTPPDGWPAALIEHLGMEPWRIPIVMVSALAVYVFLVLLLLRVFGARLLSGLSTFDTVVAIMIGSVCARVIIGHPPTLASGLVGVLTLVVLEALFGAVAGTTRGRRALAGRPRVLVAHGEVLEDQLRRSHVGRVDLHAAVRRAGLSSVRQAGCVLLESSGQISVIRSGTPLDGSVALPRFLSAATRARAAAIRASPCSSAHPARAHHCSVRLAARRSSLSLVP